MFRRVVPRPSTTLTVGALLLAGLAGCGDSNEETAGSTPAADSAPSAPGSPTLAPGSEDSDAGKVGERPGDPKLPATKTDPSNKPWPGDGLRLENRGKSGAKWRVATTTAENEFCVVAATVGVVSPPSQCGTPTTTALGVLSEAGAAEGAVEAIRKKPRSKATELLVWGIVRGDVKKVVVNYGSKRSVAQISKKSQSIKLDKPYVERVGNLKGEVPSTVSVRTFAATVPFSASNPPRNAVPQSTEPKGGTVTLTLR